MKVNITIDDELMARIDKYADDNYTTRSGLVALACSQYLNSEEVKKAIVDMAVSFRRIADNNNISDEDKKCLEHYQYMSQMLVGK